MATAVQPFAGTYELDRAHSTVHFAVRHQQISTFLASFGDVDARLTADGNTLALEGQASVQSVSIPEPREFRAHVVRGGDFFDADTHPLNPLPSTTSDPGDLGTVTIPGELTIRGAPRTLTAPG